MSVFVTLVSGLRYTVNGEVALTWDNGMVGVENNEGFVALFPMGQVLAAGVVSDVTEPA